MLLYVDKKKEKQKRIRKVSLFFFCIFFLIINTVYFNKSLHQTTQTINSYISIKYLTPWFKRADVVYLFTSRVQFRKAVVLMPALFNRENVTTTAFALSKLSQKKHQFFYLSQVQREDDLRQLVQLLYPQASFIKNMDAADVVITTDYDEAKGLAFRNGLFPFVLNYKRAQKFLGNPQFNKFMAQMFPLKKKPTSQIAKEKESIQAFIDDFVDEIKKLSVGKHEMDFASQTFFLQNIRVCLRFAADDLHCSLSESASFIQNIKNALQQETQDSVVEKIYLLTSDEVISKNTDADLAQDEGFRFQYQNSEAIMMPDDIKDYTKITDVFYALKEKAGFNPMFDASAMRFYKFKVLEVKTDENI